MLLEGSETETNGRSNARCLSLNCCRIPTEATTQNTEAASYSTNGGQQPIKSHAYNSQLPTARPYYGRHDMPTCDWACCMPQLRPRSAFLARIQVMHLRGNISLSLPHCRQARGQLVCFLTTMSTDLQLGPRWILEIDKMGARDR